MHDDSFSQESERLLIDSTDHPTKKTYSLNTGLGPSNLKERMIINTSESSNNGAVKKAMTLQRGMSLATRPDIDAIALMEKAKEVCSMPIKLSWENVEFNAKISTSKADRDKNPHLGKTKVLNIVKKVSGFAAPG